MSYAPRYEQPVSGLLLPRYARGGAAADPYAILGFSPKTVADFRSETYRKLGAPTTLGGLFTFSRASDATFTDSAGVLQTAASGVARVGHHRFEGGQWVDKGLLLESEARTNLLLNSATLSTQDVTVNNADHVLHFTGTGSITLSGAHSATLNGTGTGEGNRVELHFTPSTGTLTLTVSGTVSNAQLEETAGQRSSYIPTAGASATRAAETLTIPAANMAYSGTAMSFQMEGEMDYADEDQGVATSWVNWRLDSNNRIRSYITETVGDVGKPFFLQKTAGVEGFVVGAVAQYSPGLSVPFNWSMRNTNSAINGANEGTVLTASTTPTALPAVSATVCLIADDFMGTIAKFRQWDADLGDAGIAEATT